MLASILDHLLWVALETVVAHCLHCPMLARRRPACSDMRGQCVVVLVHGSQCNGVDLAVVVVVRQLAWRMDVVATVPQVALSQLVEVVWPLHVR